MKCVVSLRQSTLGQFDNWKDEVIAWYNDWTTSGYSDRKKHLYLYGDNNEEKSYFINTMLGK